jgi:hypothetical protein
MSNATNRLAEMMREEASNADSKGRSEAHLLRHLASTMDNMTPAERTWVEEASEEELRGFVRSLRLGCPPEETE